MEKIDTRNVKFTGKVGAKMWTWVIGEEKNKFHTAYYTLVETMDGQKVTIHDEESPVKLMEGETRYKAIKKGKEFLKRMGY